MLMQNEVSPLIFKSNGQLSKVISWISCSQNLLCVMQGKLEELQMWGPAFHIQAGLVFGCFYV